MDRGQLARLLREDVARSTGRQMTTRESERVAERILQDGDRSRPPTNQHISERARRDREED